MEATAAPDALPGHLESTCGTQDSLDALFVSMFDVRYGREDRLLADSTPSPTSATAPATTTAIDAVLGCMREGSVPLWQPLLASLLHVVQRPGANPVVRRSCFKLAFEWATAALGHARHPEASFAAPGTAVPAGLAPGSPPPFSAFQDLAVAGLTDVWSAIRKDCGANLYRVVDALPFHGLRSLVDALAAIATEEDAKETRWRQKEGALLGFAFAMKKFRRAGSVDHNTVAASPPPTALAAAAAAPAEPGFKAHRPAAIAPAALQATAPSPPAATTPSSTGASVVGFDLKTPSLSGEGFWVKPPPVPPVAAPAPAPAAASSPRRRRSSLVASLPSWQAAPLSPQPIRWRRSHSDCGDSETSPRVVAHPPLAPHVDPPAGGPGGLWFGSALHAALPLFMTTPIRRVVYPALAHTQLSVRENAIRLFATFLMRSDHRETTNALGEVLAVLQGRASLLDFAGAGECTPGEAPLGAFAAEGVLGTLVVLVRLLSPAAILRSWDALFATLQVYLAHPASTVRQVTSQVFLHVATTARDNDAVGGVKVVTQTLQGLVATWLIDDAGLAAVFGTDAVPAGDALAWQAKEGVLLSYELVINFLLSHHRRNLAPFASLAPPKPRGGTSPAATGPGSPPSRRRPPPVETSVSTPTRPFASPVRPSPWLPAAPSGTPSTPPPPPAPQSTATSVLARLQGSVPASTWWLMALQTASCLQDPQFELRRMGDQVLPLLTELLLWVAPAVLGQLWSAAPSATAAHHAAACLMMGRAMSVAVRRARVLELNLVPAGGLSADAGAAAVVAAAAREVRRLAAEHATHMHAVALCAPTDGVLVLMCEVLAMARVYYAPTGEDAAPEGDVSHAVCVIANRVLKVVELVNPARVRDAVIAACVSPRYVQQVQRAHQPSKAKATPSSSSNGTLSPLIRPRSVGRRLSGSRSPPRAPASRPPAPMRSPRPLAPSPATGAHLHRARLLDHSLATSLAPLLVPLVAGATTAEVMVLLPIVTFWVVHHEESALRVPMLEAVQACFDALLAPEGVVEDVQRRAAGGDWDAPPLVPPPAEVPCTPGAVVLAACGAAGDLAAVITQQPLEASNLRGVLAVLHKVATATVSPTVLRAVLVAVAERFREQAPTRSMPRSGSAPDLTPLMIDAALSSGPTPAGSTTGSRTPTATPTRPSIVSPDVARRRATTMGVEALPPPTDSARPSVHSPTSPPPGEGFAPSPRLWRGTALDTAAARLRRSAAYPARLSIDYTDAGSTPIPVTPMPHGDDRTPSPVDAAPVARPASPSVADMAQPSASALSSDTDGNECGGEEGGSDGSGWDSWDDEDEEEEEVGDRPDAARDEVVPFLAALRRGVDDRHSALCGKALFSSVLSALDFDDLVVIQWLMFKS